MEYQSECDYNDAGYRNLGTDEDEDQSDLSSNDLSVVVKQEDEPDAEAAAAAEEAANLDGEAAMPPKNEDASGADGQQRPVPVLQRAPLAEEAQDPRRKQRHAFTAAQVQELENFFQNCLYPTSFQRRQLAGHLNVTEGRVQVWFQNRRTKLRRDQRAMMLRNVPPAFRPPVEMVHNMPRAAIPVVEPVWRFPPLMPGAFMPPGHPIPHGPLPPRGPPHAAPQQRLPVVPVPLRIHRVHVRHVPLPQPVPSYVFAPVGMTWSPVVYGHYVGPFF